MTRPNQDKRVASFLSNPGGLFIGASLPFGGYKQSAWGREMGHEVPDAYTQTKSVVALL